MVRIKLQFDDGVLRLRDEFDWDLANPLNTYDSLTRVGRKSLPPFMSLNCNCHLGIRDPLQLPFEGSLSPTFARLQPPSSRPSRTSPSKRLFLRASTIGQSWSKSCPISPKPSQGRFRSSTAPWRSS